MTSPRNRHCPLAKTTGSGCEGVMWAKIGKVVAVLAGCIGEIAQGAGLGLQNRKPGRVGFVLVQAT
jgi:hypothetical protein